MLIISRTRLLGTLLICLVALLFALPNVLPETWRARLPAFLPHNTVNLGLDLRGGSHLLMQVDTADYLKKQMISLQDDVRARLRAKNVETQGVSIADGGLNIKLTNSEQYETARTALADFTDTMSLTREDANLRLAYTERGLRELKGRLLDQSMEIVDRRVNALGTVEPVIQRQGDDRIVLQVPGLSDPAQLKEILGRTASMTFHLLDESVGSRGTVLDPKLSVPFGTQILPMDESDSKRAGAKEGEPESPALSIAVQRRALLTGDMLTSAQAAYGQEGGAVVNFRFNKLGARKFARITSDNVNKRFAIVLDDKVLTAPVINTPIAGGSGQISGNFTIESANNLALLLRSGALPAPLKIIEERTVGPSLGSDSIAAGKAASILGVVLVMAFMVLAYGLFGVFANIALLINLVAVMGTLSFFQATLTLPGIAGIVLTLGIAVDANVLIYERIKEEIRHGRSPLNAIETGFKTAFATIIDSHVTQLIAAVLLFYFGSGSIKGFAVTLMIGLLWSIYTANNLTKLMVALWVRRTRPKTLSL